MLRHHKGMPKDKYHLDLSQEEWDKVKKIMAHHASHSSGDSNYVVKKRLPEAQKYLRHSFLVINNHPWALGPVIGTGVDAKVRVMLNQNAIAGAVKIQPANISVSDGVQEARILEKLERLMGVAIRERNYITPWLGKKNIVNKIYIAQTLINGETLFYYMHDKNDNLQAFVAKNIPVHARKAIALSAAQAIKSLHDLDIIHCDIKGANFMVDKQGTMYIVTPVDFGAAVDLEDDAEIAMMDSCHSDPYYVAPESVLYNEYSKNSDIYEFGVLLYRELGLKLDYQAICCLEEPENRFTIDELIEYLREESKHELVLPVIPQFIDPRLTLCYARQWAISEQEWLHFQWQEFQRRSKRQDNKQAAVTCVNTLNRTRGGYVEGYNVMDAILCRRKVYGYE